jgi:hypothetical protein
MSKGNQKKIRIFLIGGDQTNDSYVFMVEDVKSCMQHMCISQFRWCPTTQEKSRRVLHVPIY